MSNTMSIEELIEQLEEIKSEFGNLNIKFYDYKFNGEWKNPFIYCCEDEGNTFIALDMA